MGNFLTKKEPIVKGIENYVNSYDMYKLNSIIKVFNKHKGHKELLLHANSFEFDFDSDFYLKIKYDDKFGDKYLLHSLAICLSFLDNEYKRLIYMKKGDTSGFIDDLVSPMCDKLTFTINNYTFFKPLHYNCVKIQRWYRKKKLLI